MEWKGMSTLTAASAEVVPGGAARVAIDVLMPFHSMATTDSVESISGGLAESPSQVLNPPSLSLKAAGSRV